MADTGQPLADKKSAGIFIRNLDETAHRKFKALCAREGVNMTEALVRYINACVEKNILIVKE